MCQVAIFRVRFLQTCEPKHKMSINGQQDVKLMNFYPNPKNYIQVLRLDLTVSGFEGGPESSSISKLIVLPIKQVIDSPPPLIPYFEINNKTFKLCVKHFSY